MTAAPAAGVEENINAGLKAFIRGRFSSARDEFQKAYDADPQSAAAAFYLGYAHYKLGEPSLRMDADKQRAKELFAKAYDLDPAFQPVWGARKSE
jgi:tetratricopeptide (TPR) repeat protein